MEKKTVFLTGACGGMGFQGLTRMLKDGDSYNTLVLVRDSEKNRKMLEPYMALGNLEVVWGDLNDYDTVYKCVEKSDLILHVAAFVSPQADYNPKKAMQVNYGSTKNLITAIKEQGRENEVKFVYIGTVAETGDRMPPIHWGRVGDPIKPSMFDYYAVSKVAAERYVIESGLKYWVSLRQTGIIGPAMSKIRDAIMFHNCYDNVLEYVSDRDSGVLLRNLSYQDATNTMDTAFWGHIYNIGGGECLSTKMKKGDWSTQLEFKCAFGHTFKASPRLVLEGGHWCDECERKSWNYGQRAKVDPFFAQVWKPLHEADELREYPKEVSELDVK